MRWNEADQEGVPEHAALVWEKEAVAMLRQRWQVLLSLKPAQKRPH
jgi:hypothetical protein